MLLKAAAALLITSSLVFLALLSRGYAAGGLHLRIIVVDSPDKASQIIAALHRGEDFAVLAKQNSSDPSADAGGDLGAMRAEDLRAELHDALQQLRPGQVSPILKIPTGYAILQLLPEEKPAAALLAEGAPGNPTSMSSAGTLSVTGRAVVRQTPETSGLTQVETAFRSMPKPEGWNYDVNTICRLHQDSVSHLQAYLKTLLDSQTSSAASPTDLLERHYAAALVESYQGHMDAAIKHWEACYRIAQTDLPERVPLIEEVLGDVYLHRAEMENGAYLDPGDRCIFPPPAGAAYPRYQKTQDVQKAIQYFLTYLEKKPDDLEVKWILNLAYMTLGKYPDGVPSKDLITAPATEAPGESIRRFVDVAHEAGLDAFQMSGGVIVEDFENRGLFDVVTSGYDVCGHLLYFHNNGDGTFSDRSEAAGLAKIATFANVIQADYNNDGCMDILVLREVRDSRDLKAIRRGMLVDFTVVVDSGAPYAEKVKVHQFESPDQRPLEVHMLKMIEGAFEAKPNAVEMLAVDQKVPDFSLVDQYGRHVKFSDWSGKVIAISFVYTRCSFPEYCFRLSNNLGLVGKRFADRMDRDLVLLTITFDPASDSPGVLSKYANTWKASAKGWYFLTGRPQK